jgi:hypothetical protein
VEDVRVEDEDLASRLLKKGYADRDSKNKKPVDGCE